MANQELISVFQDTLKMCESEQLAKSIQGSIAATKFYAPDDYPEFSPRNTSANITVTKFKTIEAADYFKRKNPDSQVCILNFASANTPGGGVEYGSSAQEEAICRVTTLYPVLNTPDNIKNFYDFHKSRRDAAYTDAIIYTPNVMIVKSDTPKPVRLKPDKFKQINVITCAAPNMRAMPNNNYNKGNDKRFSALDRLYDLHVSRAKHILSVAAANNNNIVVLGAFGCGVFQNPPDIVAKAYKDVIADFWDCFDEINFAVYCPPHDRKNYEVFKKVLA